MAGREGEIALGVILGIVVLVWVYTAIINPGCVQRAWQTCGAYRNKVDPTEIQPAVRVRDPTDVQQPPGFQVPEDINGIQAAGLQNSANVAKADDDFQRFPDGPTGPDSWKPPRSDDLTVILPGGAKSTKEAHGRQVEAVKRANVFHRDHRIQSNSRRIGRLTGVRSNLSDVYGQLHNMPTAQPKYNCDTIDRRNIPDHHPCNEILAKKHDTAAEYRVTQSGLLLGMMQHPR